MNRTVKILVISFVVAAILIAAVATAAFAAPMVRGRVPTPTTADYQAWGCGVVSGNYSAITDLLKLSQDEITAQLKEGKSLVEIAATKNVTEDQLVQAILAQMKETMQQHMAGWNWTEEQLNARLKIAEQHIRQLVNTKGAYLGGCGGLNRGAAGRQAGCGGLGSQSRSGYGMMRGGGMMGGWNNSY